MNEKADNYGHGDSYPQAEESDTHDQNAEQPLEPDETPDETSQSEHQKVLEEMLRDRSRGWRFGG